MEFPFGHHHHHPDRRREEEEEERRRREQQHHPHQPYPDPYGRLDPSFPPTPLPPHLGPVYPPVQHVAHEVNRHEPHHGHHSGPAYPPVQHVAHEVNRHEPHHGHHSGPVYPPVQHVAHEVNRQEPHHGIGGHLPFSHHHHHDGPPSQQGHGGSSHERTVRVYTKAHESFSLTIRHGQVILAPTDRSDELQHWIKDEKFSTKVKDEEGLPSFALVNKVTREAIKHSIGATHAVRLVPYNPDYLDESILWTESKDTGGGFRCIRMVNNIRLNFDAFHGDKDHGGVHDGTSVVLWEWLKGDNQRWKITPY